MIKKLIAIGVKDIGELLGKEFDKKSNLEESLLDEIDKKLNELS